MVKLGLRWKQTIEQFIRSFLLFVQLCCSFVHKLLQMICVFLHHGNHVFNDVRFSARQQKWNETGRKLIQHFDTSIFRFNRKFVILEL